MNGLIKSHDAAKLLGISERKLWELKASGELTYIQIGRAVRYSVTDLEQWIERNKCGG